MFQNATRFVCLVGLAAAVPCTAEGEPPLALKFLNYADVSTENLEQAEAQASQVFFKAGVRIERAGTASGPRVRVWVYLLPESMAVKSGRRGQVFGYALGDMVYLFTDRIGGAAKEAKVAFPCALGHILAHELGHVLLGEKGHHPMGIMRPKVNFIQMKMGALEFTPDQATRMRKALLVSSRVQ